MSESREPNDGPTPMSSEGQRPRFVDEHRIVIDAPREHVWRALRAYCRGNLARDSANLGSRLLGAVPASGFGIHAEDPGVRIELAGRHRFSRYLLVFVLGDSTADTTELTAVTYADFPKIHGKLYRLMVISSGIHVLAMRRMLSAIQRAGSR